MVLLKFLIIMMIQLKEVNISLVENDIMAYEMFPRNEIDYFGEPFYSIPFDRLGQVNTLPEKLVFPSTKYWYISIPNETNEKIFEKPELRKLMKITLLVFLNILTHLQKL